MNEAFAIPEATPSLWRVELVQKHSNGVTRWLTSGPWGVLTAFAKRASTFSTEAAAAAVAARTPPHPWGKWEARPV